MEREPTTTWSSVRRRPHLEPTRNGGTPFQLGHATQRLACSALSHTSISRKAYESWMVANWVPRGWGPE